MDEHGHCNLVNVIHCEIKKLGLSWITKLQPSLPSHQVHTSGTCQNDGNVPAPRPKLVALTNVTDMSRASATESCPETTFYKCSRLPYKSWPAQGRTPRRGVPYEMRGFIVYTTHNPSHPLIGPQSHPNKSKVKASHWTFHVLASSVRVKPFERRRKCTTVTLVPASSPRQNSKLSSHSILAFIQGQHAKALQHLRGTQWRKLTHTSILQVLKHTALGQLQLRTNEKVTSCTGTSKQKLDNPLTRNKRTGVLAGAKSNC